MVVNLNSSSSELKLLRVLQTLVNLSGKDTGEGWCAAVGSLMAEIWLWLETFGRVRG